MEAQLSDIQEADLVANSTVNSKEFNETILTDSETILDREATSSKLTLFCKLVIHPLERVLEKIWAL